MEGTSIVIPSRNEIFLQKTILDILEKAEGPVEIFPVLDGYDPPEEQIVKDDRVHYTRLEPIKQMRKRHIINMTVPLMSYKYIMSVDAHCMFDKGFDTILKDNHYQENLVQIPRRHRLDAENWGLQTQVDDRPPIDYEYTMWPKKFDPPQFHGFKWDDRTKKRWDIQIDDIMTFQGSCWFMTKDYFNHMKFLNTDLFGGWAQDAEEISYSTWMTGGRMVVNKLTWYAHLHKGQKYGRMYFMNKHELTRAYIYSFDYWMNNRLPNRVHDFDWIIDKFWPIPGWSENWKEELLYNANA